MARINRTPMVILGILGIAEGRPLSGYDIKQVIDSSVSHFWSESYGQLYPVLKRLAAEGLIRARTAKEKGRKKIMYGITAKGEKHLAQWLEMPPEPSKPRDELILKIFFGNKTRPEVLIKHLQAQRDRVKAFGDQYAGWAKQLENSKEICTPFPLITLRGGLAMGAAFVAWADETLATLAQMRETHSAIQNRD